ncbi:putative toxin-antitoxin system toxin component, PIN family [Candidatus Woesearchaeota archaeon]|nr:putative toxin-antitoxin system toxin component, PIN family [Candidatus Woesearchaeota archaeon]
MKVTVDTNFLISATQWDYSVAHKLLKKFIISDAIIFTTQDILDEAVEVLERDFEYNKNEAKNIIEKILLFANLVEPKQKIEIIKDDPDDNKVIECAVESSSDYILTYDKHLLKIKKYKGIRIIKPEEILKQRHSTHL